MVALSGVTQGAVIGNRYKISSPPAVWVGNAPVPGTASLADDEILGRQVTLFAITGDNGPDLLDAARRAALLADERVPRILDVGVDSDLVFVVTESPDGFPLSDLLRSGPLRPDQARALVGETAQALAAADARGLHHTRLIPSSIGVDSSGGVHVTGVAIDVAAASGDGPDAADASHADALGLVSVLYAALTARWPAAEGVDKLQPAPVTGGVIDAPADVARDIPNDLDSLAAAVFSGTDDGPRTPHEVASYVGPWEKSALTALGDRVDRAKYAKAKTVSALSGGLRPRSSYPGAEPPSRPASAGPDTGQRTGSGQPAAGAGSASGAAGWTAAAAATAGAAGTGAATHHAAGADSESSGQRRRPNESGTDHHSHRSRQGRTGAAAGKPKADETEKLPPEVQEAIAMRGASRFPLAGNAVLPEPQQSGVEEPTRSRATRNRPSGDRAAGKSPATPTSPPAAAPTPASHRSAPQAESKPEPEPETEPPAADDIGADDQPTTVIPPVDGRGSAGDAPTTQSPTAQDAGGDYHRHTAQFPVVGTAGAAAGAGAAGEGAATQPADRPDRAPRRKKPAEGAGAAGTAAEGAGAAGTAAEGVGSAGIAAAGTPAAAGAGSAGSGSAGSGGGLAGRMGNRLAIIVIAAIVVVGLIIALTTLSKVGNDKTSATASSSPSTSQPASPSPSSSPSSTSTKKATKKPKPGPVKLSSATSLDPQGDGSEHSELTKNLIDSSKSSSWMSETYTTPKFGNLKSGLGFSVTLASKSTVHTVKLQSSAGGGKFEIRSSDDGKYDGSTVIGSGDTKNGVTTVKLKKPVKTSHVVIWFTQLPAGSSGYRIKVSDVALS